MVKVRKNMAKRSMVIRRSSMTMKKAVGPGEER